MKSIALPRWLRPAPDSVIAEELRCGRQPWINLVHLVWSGWVFMTPLMSSGEYGFTLRWALLTLLSYPLFLWLYVMALVCTPRRARASALGMVALSLLLLPWYPSGLSYFVFGCVMLQPERGRSTFVHVATLMLLNAVLLGYAFWLGYPWQALVWLPNIVFIVGVLVGVDRLDRRRQVALKLSQEEVRRLAALAERERIGRDLHDLLGHTLSMVALKSDLAGRLLERDPQAARGEIAEVSRVAREALAQVRGAVSGIRAAGIAAELASARLLLESDGIGFDYRLDEGFSGSSLPPGVEDALAMTVREAATNIQRHAQARSARVEFGIDGDEAVLSISDDGRGGVIVPGNGLGGMRERIEAVGGMLRVEAGKERGTTLQARVPLARENSAGPDLPA